MSATTALMKPKNVPSRRRIGATGLLVAMLLALATAMAPAASANGPATDEKAAAFELDFLTGMIDHHNMAVMMAQPCLDKAVHPELRQLCASIIATQSAEIETMQGWLQDWYGIMHEPTMTTGSGGLTPSHSPSTRIAARRNSRTATTAADASDHTTRPRGPRGPQ